MAERIDAFVEYTNRSQRERRYPITLPPELREGPPDSSGTYLWRIQRADHGAELRALEQRLPASLPPSLRYLLANYTFPPLTIGPIRTFANTGEAIWEEISVAMFRDEMLVAALHRSGFVEIGKPRSGIYDPICLDTRNADADGEYPLVRIDAELAVASDRVDPSETIASSFLELVATHMAASGA